MVYAAGSDLPVGNSLSALAGHTVAYFTAGILLAIGLEAIADRLANPQGIDFYIEIAVGIVLVSLAIPGRVGNQATQKREPRLTLPGAFGWGATINFIGLPFALPYFAALDQILKADLNAPEAIGVVALYNIAYALPFATIPLAILILGGSARPILHRINDTLTSIAGNIMPFVLGGVGVALLVDAATYFITGESLF